MARIVLVINSSKESINQLNEKVINASGNPHEGIVKCRNYLDSLLAGAVDASVQATTRDTDPAVATSGSGSAQRTYDLS